MDLPAVLSQQGLVQSAPHLPFWPCIIGQVLPPLVLAQPVEPASSTIEQSTTMAVIENDLNKRFIWQLPIVSVLTQDLCL